MFNTLLNSMSGGAKTPRQPRPPAQVRLLPVAMATVAALLTVKAVAVAQSVAETPAAAAPAPSASTSTATSATSTPDAAAAPAACTGPSLADQAGLSQSEVDVLQALQARRQQLDQRSTAMDTQDAMMSAAQQRLDQRITELRRLQTTVGQLLGQLDQAQEARLNSLVDVYQRMRAKDAATVFNGLNDTVLVQVASRMRQENLAEVMGHMTPTRAQALTQMLADQSRPPADGAALLQQAANATPAPAASASAAPAGR